MKQLIIPFKENADIPESHLYAIRVCNSGAFAYKQSFYKLKSSILKKYGHEADYDLQIIKKCAIPVMEKEIIIRGICAGIATKAFIKLSGLS